MRSILSAIWKAMLAVVLVPVGLFADAVAQSDNAPAPVRKAAQRFTNERQAKFVRRYCRALADGHEPPKIDKLPETTRNWLGRIDKDEAGRIALMSSDDVLKRMKGANGEETPKPSNGVPLEVRQRIRRTRREARQVRAPEPESGPEPTLLRPSPSA